MNPISKILGHIGVVPVIKVSPPEKAVPLAEALMDGGLPVMEITFRAAGAERAIAAVRDALPEMLVGAGTVLSREQVRLAVEAGAQFIVTPGFNPRVVGYCVERGLPVFPGCSSASDIEAALEFGLDTVKFFPAEQLGGLSMMKALSGPYSQMRFIPTGGIHLTNLSAYLRFDRVLACGGTFMVKEDYIQNEDWNKITTLCRTVIDTVLQLSLGHVGLHVDSQTELAQTAQALASLFNLPLTQTPAAAFVGRLAEVTAAPTHGAKGHIAIAAADVARARYHLERRGYAFWEESAQYDETGRLKLIYLRNEMAGFAVHLCARD